MLIFSVVSAVHGSVNHLRFDCLYSLTQYSLPFYIPIYVPISVIKFLMFFQQD